jgi:hypothetical protein
MPSPKGNKFAVGNEGSGRHSQLNPKFIRRAELGWITYMEHEYIEQAKKLCQLGLTDPELAVFFGVHLQTINNWKAKYPEFLYALKAGKEVADNRVVRSLYARAVGYDYEATKIFMPANRSKPVYAPYIEHVPPDTTAGIFWLKNRDPQHWRDTQQLEHVLGKYIISDKPMSEEQWARERADVIDVEPEKNNLTADREARHGSSPTLPQIYTRKSK